MKILLLNYEFPPFGGGAGMATYHLAGGGVSIGLEVNIWYDFARTRLATNRELVERILLIAGAMGRKPYRCSEARGLLGLN